jgi:hypothetical protein
MSDSIRVGQSGDRIPVVKTFFASVQTDLRVNPSSYITGTGCPRVKWAGFGVNHPPPSSTDVKKEYNYTSTPTLGLQGLL